jgi:hypothetical protein
MSAGSQNPAEFVTSENRRIPVHFNPASLQFTLANTLERKGNKPQQFVKESKAQLTMELVFDTTDESTNVCTKTEEIAKLMEPGKDKVPPVVTFDWGEFTFRGIIDSYKETIDFFSPEGLPLRCTVNLSMSRQEKVFDSRSDSSGGGGGGGSGGGAGGAGAGGPGGSGGSGGAPGDVVDTAPQTNQSTTSVASQGGDPSAGRAIAESNGEESIRFPQNASLSIDTSVPLGPPVAFASGGAGFSLEAGFSAGAADGGGFGISGGAGIGVGAGLSVQMGTGFSAGGGLSAGAGLSVGIGISVDVATTGGLGGGFSVSSSTGLVSGPIAGGSASAGVSASQGAFAHLRAPSLPDRPARLQGHRYTHHTESVGYATGSRAKFQLGGMAMTDSATVEGDTTTLRGRIRFGET